MFKDTEASILESEDYHRIIYQEDENVRVTLDITKYETSLKRQGKWLTHGLFSLENDSFLLIKNELGTLQFNLEIESYVLKNNSLFIKYHLLEDGEKNQAMNLNVYGTGGINDANTIIK